MTNQNQPLIHIRTPTYKRPTELKRCLESLRSQTHTNWVCDVFDDDPDGSARDVVLDFDDPRLNHIQNNPQKFASKNIDQCFTRNNPHNADYFCVVEDDNLILPDFCADNIRVCLDEKIDLVFRNQLIEFASGTDAAHFSNDGILDGKMHEGRYDPDLFRLALVADIGVSNGGLFWSGNAISELELKVDCSATLQEYLRTFAIMEPIYIAMKPLAVWAENGADTTRDLGVDTGYLRSELNLKRSVRILQRKAWALARPKHIAAFLGNSGFAYSNEVRARGLVKSHIKLNVGRILPFREKFRLAYRGSLIRVLGRPEPGLKQFFKIHRA